VYQLNKYLQLFTVFARMGAVTFGGGYAMLPILQAEVVNKYHWATDEELADYYAVGQCTPGIIAVNTATFIGLKEKGIPGGIAATLGVIFPSMVIITVIAAFLTNFADYTIVKDAFAGIRVCVCILILQAVLKLLKKAVIDKITLLIFIAVMFINMLTDISPAWLVVLAGVIGILTKKLGGEA
jgi:chromate transporter